MSVNRKRGIKRLAIAILVPWFLFWGAYGAMAYADRQTYEQSLNASSAKSAKFFADTGHFDPDQLGIGNSALQLMSEASTRMNRAFAFGVMYPFALLVVSLIGWWVYRGFRPKPDRA